MLISLLALLLISNALTLRKDKSILFSRVVMVSLIHTSFLAYNNLIILPLDKGIGIFGGLIHVTVFTQIFNIFIFLLSALILTLTPFYPRRVYLNQISSLSFLLFLLFNGGAAKFNYNKQLIKLSVDNNYIIRVNLIILYVTTGISCYSFFSFIITTSLFIYSIVYTLKKKVKVNIQRDNLSYIGKIIIFLKNFLKKEFFGLFFISITFT